MKYNLKKKSLKRKTLKKRQNKRRVQKNKRNTNKRRASMRGGAAEEVEPLPFALHAPVRAKEVSTQGVPLRPLSSPSFGRAHEVQRVRAAAQEVEGPQKRQRISAPREEGSGLLVYSDQNQAYYDFRLLNNNDYTCADMVIRAIASHDLDGGGGILSHKEELIRVLTHEVIGKNINKDKEPLAIAMLKRFPEICRIPLITTPDANRGIKLLITYAIVALDYNILPDKPLLEQILIQVIQNLEGTEHSQPEHIYTKTELENNLRDSEHIRNLKTVTPQAFPSNETFDRF